jgi:hypothetical protein
MFNPDQKPKTDKDPKYLAWIRKQKCGVYGCGRGGEPHHVRRQRWGAGTAKKPHDYVCVSRCREHHDPVYDNFSEVMMVEHEIIDNLMRYIKEHK